MNDDELADALRLTLEDAEIQAMLRRLEENVRSVRLGTAERDHDVEDLITLAAYRVARSRSDSAEINDARELAQHLFALVARRLGSTERP